MQHFCCFQLDTLYVGVLDKSMAHGTTACRQERCSLGMQQGRDLLEVASTCRQMSNP